MVKTRGLDCIFIGRNDLAVAMGYPGRADAPEVQKAVEKVVSATLNAGLTLQIATDEKEAPYWIKSGASFFPLDGFNSSRED